MKTFGKISLVAGLAAAVIVLLRRRKDGTRLLDDVTHQISTWANMLVQTKEKLSSANGHPGTMSSSTRSAPRTAMKTAPGGSTGRHPGDIQE